jgi:hypothetical protein
MGGRNLSERERRELANAHRGEVVPESAVPVQPQQLDQVVSLRLDPNTITTLREIANRRGMTMSDLLRQGAGMVIVAAGQTQQITDLKVDVVVEPHTSTNQVSEFTANPVRQEPKLSATA